MQAGLLLLQVGDQFLQTIDRDLVHDGSFNPAIAFNRLVFSTHFSHTVSFLTQPLLASCMIRKSFRASAPRC